MNKPLSALIFAAIGMIAGSAAAQETPWLLRVRAVYLDTAKKSDPVGGAGAADRLTVSSETIPEIDLSYFFTPNWAAELVATYPQKHHVQLDGKDIGTFKHLPPTLLLQYHFVLDAPLKPYIGAGVNYTTMSKVHLLDGAASLEHDSVGLALQAGLDYAIDKKWSLNLDVKKVRIRSDVYIGGARVSRVKPDPLMLALGVGYRF
ncbi:OmpW/AlkL family protein [Duganella aceris]|uniref:OmpW family protein n=1 Tax=Duganella aceris TaxID=2703883 RepID=A0ABX0FEW2_9BURK|nr:OmpW family outer membrane protein [Duganella aceris]NGZ83074.1 OmpW family protein [Duganella aceris]